MIFLMAQVFAPSVAAVIAFLVFYVVAYCGVGAALVAGAVWLWRRWRR